MRAPMIRARSPMTMRWAWMSPWISPSICTSPFDSRLPVMERSAPMTEAERLPRAGAGGGLTAAGGGAGACRCDAGGVLPPADGPSRSGFLVNMDCPTPPGAPPMEALLTWIMAAVTAAWRFGLGTSAGFRDWAMVAWDLPGLGRGGMCGQLRAKAPGDPGAWPDRATA